MKHFLLGLVVVLSVPGLVLAVSEEFTVKVNVGDDVTPPSTPTLLSVTPIASTQIDVSWSVATDNWIFGGYVLLRDGSPIATTTLTTYNDTGLTAETLYTYEVYAFDAAGNISTTSNSLATTTPPVVVPPPVATSTQADPVSGTQVIRLIDFTVTPGTQSALLAWQTARPARFVVRWGRTDDYADGYIQNDAFVSERTTNITGLEPGTRYLYELIGYLPSGRSIVLRTGDFTTKEDAGIRVMPNVDRLQIVVAGEDVRLTYRMPEESGARVRIVRSHLGFPTDLSDGAVVYDGVATEVTDREALSQYPVQYYTVFVIGTDGTVSSGAVGVAIRSDDAGAGAAPGLGDRATTTSPMTPGASELPTLALTTLSPESLLVEQGGRITSFAATFITLDQREAFTVRVPREALPRHLKAIVVTLLDPTDQRRRYSFLLRLNKTGEAYEATVAPIGLVGSSRLQLEIYDFTEQAIGRYRVPVTFALLTEVSPAVVFPDALVPLFSRLLPYLGGMAFLGLVWWLWLLWRSRRTEDNR